MSMLRVHFQRGGEGNQHEEFWFLLEDGENAHQLQYRWHHLNFDGLEGIETYSLVDGLKRCPPEAASTIRALLGIC